MPSILAPQQQHNHGAVQTILAILSSLLEMTPLMHVKAQGLVSVHRTQLLRT
jgi:hypothetical protein